MTWAQSHQVLLDVLAGWSHAPVLMQALLDTAPPLVLGLSALKRGSPALGAASNLALGLAGTTLYATTPRGTDIGMLLSLALFLATWDGLRTANFADIEFAWAPTKRREP